MLGAEAVVKPELQDAPGLSRGPAHGLRVGKLQGDGLLAQDVAAGGESALDLLAVKSIGRSDEDGFDAVGANRLFHRRRRQGDVEVVRRFARGVPAGIENADRPAPGGGKRGEVAGGGDRSRAENRESDCGFFHGAGSG